MSRYNWLKIILSLLNPRVESFMRLIKRLIPGAAVDAIIVGSLIAGTALVMPKIIYAMLKKDGVFRDN